MTAAEKEAPENSPGVSPGSLTRTLAITAAVVSGAAAAAKTVNRVIAGRASPLGAAFAAEESSYDWTEGPIRTMQRGDGTPLLLVHGVGLGASAYEWRHNVEPLSRHFRVVAYDLLGFGRSEKPALHYTGELYVRLMRDFIRDVIGRPVHIVASGLSAAYAVALACREPFWFQQLILVSPVGIQALHQRPSAAGRNLYRSLSPPILGESCYFTLASRARIENFLRYELYHDGSRVTPEMVDHYWTSAHQPGARWAIRSLLAGYLNTKIREEFRLLERPVTLVFGQEAVAPPPHHAEAFLKANPDAELEIFSQCGVRPHDERADAFQRMLEERLLDGAAHAGRLPTLDKDQG